MCDLKTERSTEPQSNNSIESAPISIHELLGSARNKQCTPAMCMMCEQVELTLTSSLDV